MSTRRKKEIGIILAVIACTIALFLRLISVVGGEYFPLLIGVMAIAVIVWMALLSYALALLNSVGTSLSLVVITPLIVLSVGKLSMEALAGALVMMIFLAVGQQHLTQAIRNHIQYHTVDIFYGGTRMIISSTIAALVGLSTATFVNILAADQLLSERMVERLLRPADPILQGVIPGYSAQRSINELIEAQLQQQLGESAPASPLIPQQKDAIVRNLERQLATSISGQETIASLTANFINRKVREVLVYNKLLFSLAVIVVLFVTLRATLAPLLLWPTLGMIACLVYLSRKIGLALILVTSEKVELLRL